MVETCQAFWEKNGQQKRAERRKKGTSVEELIGPRRKAELPAGEK